MINIVERLRDAAEKSLRERILLEAAQEIENCHKALRQVLLKDERGNPWHTFDELRMIAHSALKLEEDFE